MVIHIESRIKAIEAARVSLDKKAKDTLILELKDLTFIADYFVICSGENVSQVKAIVEYIGEILKRDYGIKPMRIEGLG
ncbi:MAG: ribosome silencing factor, partial [Thermodesulfovibrio sp.]|nr:ribosome silencing factor [Thermodesulfovibrio sp.]